MRKAGVGYKTHGCFSGNCSGGVVDVVVEQEERVHMAAEGRGYVGQVSRLKQRVS